MKNTSNLQKNTHFNIDSKEQLLADKAWSLISPLPVVRYLPKYDEYVVTWNGALMPHIIAFNIAMRQYGAFQSPSVQQAMEKTYYKLYNSGAFEDMFEWTTPNADTGLTAVKYLNKLMHNFAMETVKGKTPFEVFDWFNYKNAKVSNAPY